jgi:predicted DCC family thiol-disulfide oxidoreductase YuxK
MTKNSNHMYTIFWDGECRFCGRCVSWALAQAGNDLQAIPYQQVSTPPMDDALRLACRRAVHLEHPGGQLEKAGQACLSVLELIGYKRLARWGRRRPLIWCIELVYWFVAQNRRIFSRVLFRQQPPPSGT